MCCCISNISVTSPLLVFGSYFEKQILLKPSDIMAPAGGGFGTAAPLCWN